MTVPILSGVMTPLSSERPRKFTGSFAFIAKPKKPVKYGDVVEPGDVEVVVPVSFARPFCARRAALRMLAEGALSRPVAVIQYYDGELIVREVFG